MKLENIIKIVCAVLGLLGVVFLFRVIANSDDDIKMAASMGDFSLISPLISACGLVQAKPFLPSIFIAQDPQTP